jgi:cobalt/nickel transport system permease protein
MHHVPEDSSPSDSQQRCLLTGCDIRVRLILTLAAILAVVASSSIGFGLAVLACSLVALAIARTSFGDILHRLAAPMALAVVVLLARTLLTGTTPLAEFDLGVCRLIATREGLWAGALIASRILGSLGLVTLLCRNASMQELSAAQRWARLPHAWIEIALLMYRYLHLFSSQAACVVSAQRVRLGYRNMRRSLVSAGGAAGIVLLRSLDQAQRSHEAMIARGYRGAFPLPKLPPLSRFQATAACVGVAAIAAVFALAERWCP